MQQTMCLPETFENTIAEMPLNPHSLLSQTGELVTQVSNQDRIVKKHDTVRVYRNLVKRGLFSIQATSGAFRNKVVSYGASIVLTNVIFKISLAGLARVRREKVKNVHSFAIGQLSDIATEHLDLNNRNYRAITYNPYVSEYFYDVQTLQPECEQLPLVVIQGSRVYVPL